MWCVRARWAFSCRTIRLLGLFVLLALPPLVVSAAGVLKHKRVLTLYWYGKDFPSNIGFDHGIKTTLQKDGVEYYAEYFEPNLFPGEGQAAVLRDYLREKYSDRKIDVVVAMSSASADFLLKYRHDLFVNVPIVFHTINKKELQERAAGTSTGVVPENVHARTLDLALRTHPNTRQVYVINGTIERDKWAETLMKDQFSGFESKVAITYLTDLPLDALLDRVKGLPDRSIIFYSRQDYEEPGRHLSQFDVLLLIAHAAKIPIYSSGAYVGQGTIGGYAINAVECGVQAGNIALQILRGAQPQAIPVVELPGVPIFDWRELGRWGIRLNTLPPRSEVRFRTPTLFEQYQWHIIGALTLCAVQSLLIAALLTERRKRRRAQEALRERLEFETLLSELSADFSSLPPNEVDGRIEKWLERLGKFLGTGPGVFDLPASGNSANGGANCSSSRNKRDPIRIDGLTWALRFPCSPVPHVWSDLLPRLSLAGEIFANAKVRKITEEALRESQERYKLATSSGGVIVWDWDLETSQLYADPLLKSMLGYEDHEICNRLDDWIQLVHPDEIDFVLERVQDYIQSDASRFEVEHRLLQKDGGVRWFLASGTAVRNHEGIPLRMIGTETDITHRKLAEQELEHLSARLLDLQDQERQRVARELHEGTAQDIAAITVNLESLKRSRVKLPAKFHDALTECQTLCRQTLNDVRTLSYVLHPPILDTAGLLAALRWYVGEFSKSTGIDVQLVSPQEVGRLPTAIETDLFRIVQECLENVRRHSGSGTAQVHLELQSGQIVLKVQDQGRGMTQKTLRTVGADSKPPGVGLSEIRQRLRDLDGRLEIESSNCGTTITAVVPLDVKAVRAFATP